MWFQLGNDHGHALKNNIAWRFKSVISQLITNELLITNKHIHTAQKVGETLEAHSSSLPHCLLYG